MKTTTIDGIEYELVPIKKAQLGNIGNKSFKLDLTVKVVKHWGYTKFVSKKDGKEGSVLNLLVGDDTGTKKLVLWGALADKLEMIEEGSVIRITNAYSKIGQTKDDGTSYIEIHSSRNSEVFILE